MNINDLNQLTLLINKYGIQDIKKFIEINDQLLTYIDETRIIDTINGKQSSFLYNEENNKILFTNQKTSVFCINKKIINLDLLLANKEIQKTQKLFVEPSEIQKYFDKSKQYFGSWYEQVTSIHNNEFILTTNDTWETINLNEYKLIKLLLENVKIYRSLKNSLVYAEGENGYAYVLGKKNNAQLRF